MFQKKKKKKRGTLDFCCFWKSGKVVTDAKESTRSEKDSTEVVTILGLKNKLIVSSNFT